MPAKKKNTTTAAVPTTTAPGRDKNQASVSGRARTLRGANKNKGIDENTQQTAPKGPKNKGSKEPAKPAAAPRSRAKWTLWKQSLACPDANLPLTPRKASVQRVQEDLAAELTPLKVKKTKYVISSRFLSY